MGRDALTRVRVRARSTVTALADLLLPRVCVVCTALLPAQEPELVCGRCWLAAQELPRPRCARCGHPADVRRAASTCRWCELLPPYVRSARSAFA
ncbi:MAG: hypothetical protein JWN79_2517, partial [Gemmatimonadetes bacterium]|nr:hypothetical protein [Gemmatimonadota bacterium]